MGPLFAILLITILIYPLLTNIQILIRGLLPSAIIQIILINSINASFSYEITSCRIFGTLTNIQLGVLP
jgi:hypothetical protein